MILGILTTEGESKIYTENVQKAQELLKGAKKVASGGHEVIFGKEASQ